MTKQDGAQLTAKPISGDKIWVLKDDRVGHANQALAVAQYLGKSFVEKDISYNSLSKLPNILKGKSLIGVDVKTRSSIKPPYPDIVIAAGRRTAPIARYIKNKSQGKTFIAQIMYPGYGGLGDFDLISAPYHDNIKGDNIMQTIGSPHSITKDILQNEADIWRKIILDEDKNHNDKKIISVLIGGDTKYAKFSTQHMADLADKISYLAEKTNSIALISTSRRTSQNTISTLISNIKCKFYLFDFNNHKYRPHLDVNTKKNPYLGFLGLADIIIVTGDSMSMCSEACAVGKSVYIFAPDKITNAKYQRMHDSLYSKGYAKNLSYINIDNGQLCYGEKAQILDEAKAVADKILQLR